MGREVIAIVGPSGSGKDTLIDGLIAACPHIHRVRRTITRPPSDSTEPFESVDDAAFDALLDHGAFALHWGAHGLRYGLRHSEFAHDAVVFNGSRKAIAQAAAVFPELRVVLVTVSAQVLAGRLQSRGRETLAEIEQRLNRAAMDLPSGLNCIRVSNDGTPAQGIAALIDAIHPLPVSPA